jgi:hypothetical protein
MLNVRVVIHTSLSLVCPAPRENVPDEDGLCGALVVEDHSPVADVQPEVLAAREPPDIERAIIDIETSRAQYSRARMPGSAGQDAAALSLPCA